MQFQPHTPNLPPASSITPTIEPHPFLHADWPIGSNRSTRTFAPISALSLNTKNTQTTKEPLKPTVPTLAHNNTQQTRTHNQTHNQQTTSPTDLPEDYICRGVACECSVGLKNSLGADCCIAAERSNSGNLWFFDPGPVAMIPSTLAQGHWTI